MMEELLPVVLIVFAGVFWIADIHVSRQKALQPDPSDSVSQLESTGTAASNFLKTIIPVFGALIIALSLWQQANLAENDNQLLVWLLLGLGIIIFVRGVQTAESKKTIKWSDRTERGFHSILTNQKIRITIYIVLTLAMGWIASRSAGDQYLMKDFPLSIISYLVK